MRGRHWLWLKVWHDNVGYDIDPWQWWLGDVTRHSHCKCTSHAETPSPRVGLRWVNNPTTNWSALFTENIKHLARARMFTEGKLYHECLGEMFGIIRASLVFARISAECLHCTVKFIMTVCSAPDNLNTWQSSRYTATRGPPLSSLIIHIILGSKLTLGLSNH